MVKASGIDRTLLTVSLLLIAIGFLMIFSTTPVIAQEKFGDSFHFFNKQLLFLFLGLLVFALLILFRSPFYLNPRLVMAIMALAFTGLSLVFFFQKVNNTSRWIRIGGMSIQPSEFAKIALVLYLALMLSRTRDRRQQCQEPGPDPAAGGLHGGADPQGTRFRQFRAHRRDHPGHAVRGRPAPEILRWSSSCCWSRCSSC